MKRYLIFMTMGFEIVGLILGSYFLGIELDKKYNSNGLIFVGLSFVCLLGWLIRVIWMVNKIQKEEEKNPSSSEL